MVKNNRKSFTIRAMREVESGDTVICDTMDDYLKLVGYGIQD